MGKTSGIFVGMFFNDETFKIYNDLGWKSSSQQIVQKAIIKGLIKNDVEISQIISIPNVPHYPKFRKLFLNNSLTYFDKRIKITTIGFLNFKYISNFLKIVKTYYYSIIFSKNINNLDYLFIYSLHSPLLNFSRIFKKKNKNIKTVLFIPDLPHLMDPRMGIIKKILKKIDWIFIKLNLRYIDYFVIFSEKMADYLKLKKNKYILMEGLKDFDNFTNEPRRINNNKFVITYSGVLSKSYHVDFLLKLIMELNPKKFDIWLIGDGDLVEYAKEISLKHENLKIFGFISDTVLLNNILLQSSLVVNLRNSNDQNSAYSFPSKLIDYLSLGIPVLTTNFPSLLSEYHGFLNICGDTYSDFKKKILELECTDYNVLEKKANDGKIFIKTYKSSISQLSRLIYFFSFNK